MEFQYDLSQLATGILYVNLGRAGVEFNSTTRSHPSYQVFVTRLPGGDLFLEEHNLLFPFHVRWDVWKNIVAPLFVDSSTLVKVGALKNETLRQWVNREMLTVSPASLIQKIEQALIDLCQLHGYVPRGTEATLDPGLVGPPVRTNGSPYRKIH